MQTARQQLQKQQVLNKNLQKEIDTLRQELQNYIVANNIEVADINITVADINARLIVREACACL